MDVRAQVSMVFHLDKCIGCHTCSVACKNVWTDRKGAEYMWWNNVETKPGTGYPTLWEDQTNYRGGWEMNNGHLRLKSTGKIRDLTNIFYNPSLPTIDDYYEPWTYRYQDLFDAPAGDDQPTARPISMVTGDPIDIEAGPNWDDDLGGSPVYAENDLNLGALTEEERAELFQLERMAFFYLPRICNHCLNPACVAACPSGAMYKRGEDGVVLVNQDICRGWRFCVSACPYKKVYYNWSTGKSEKCVLCFPRLETGQAPACFHSCVGRIRYLAPILYDADALPGAAEVPDEMLVESHRGIILDPSSSEVIEGARRNGIEEGWIKAAQDSPVYKLVKVWKIALPLHPEFRTLPNLFYVPPLSAMKASMDEGSFHLDADEVFATIDQARVPVRYLARMFSAGKESIIREVYAKLMAIRLYNRAKSVGDVDLAKAEKLLAEANCSVAEAAEIYKLTTVPTFQERLAVPPYQRELRIQETEDPFVRRGQTGLGHRVRPERRF